jgi:hypothetical protein
MTSRTNEVTPEATAARPDLRDELMELASRDQAARLRLIDDSSDSSHAAIEEIDRQNTARMRELVSTVGWPGRTLVGDDGAHAAWLLVQHADLDAPFQRRCLALMEPLVASGGVLGSHYAYLYDRIAVGENRPQRFGTQFGPDSEPWPIEDEGQVDARRAAFGLGSMDSYREEMLKMYGPNK